MDLHPCDFEELLARSPAPIELADHWALTPEERIDAYEQAGCYIVDHSDVLIAVWDGRDSRGRGGTRAVIEYAHDQGVPVLLVPAEEAEPGPGHFDWAVFKPLSAPAPLLEAFRRINEYNRSSLRQVRLSEMLEASYGELDEVLAKLSIRDKCRPVLNWAVPHFVRADALAVQYQFRYRMLGRAIYFLAAFAVTAVAAQTVFAPTTTAWLGFEIGMLLLLIVALWIGRRGQVHERWMGYRSLAEAFRSALFLSVSHAAEVSEDQDEGARIRAPWFQRAFSEAWPQRPEVSLREGEAGDLREFLLAAWINDQIGFHRSTARRSEGRRQLYTWIVYALAGVTITVAALHIAHVPSGEGWARAFEFLAIMLPGFGAAVTGLREHGQHRLHEERSKRTAERLELLRRQPDPGGDLDDVRKLANATQRVIVEENLNWSGVVEFQDLELVI